MPPTAPAAPKHLPTDIQAKWQAAYAKAFIQLKGDHPDYDESTLRQAATIEANRMQRVPAPETYQEAAKLADWQVVKRVEEKGQLTVVTADGKKYSFAVPKAKAS